MDQILMCRGFSVCKGYMTEGEIYKYTSSNTSSDGVFSQVLYAVNCEETYLIDENENNLKMCKGEVYDLRKYYKQPYMYKANKGGGAWVCINPIPANKFYNVEKLSSGDKKTIVGDEREQVVFCIDGKVNINDKLLLSLNYSRILNGKTAEVTVGENSVALYLYT